MKHGAPSSEAEERVYVVDDDPAVREALSRLMRSAGLGARCFPSAQAFLDQALEDVPSCLVLDLGLPDASGLELQETLGRMGRDIPIVFITGHGDIPTTVRALKSGALDFLEKPFSDDDLLRAIRAALATDRRARAQRAEIALIRKRFETLTPREREVMALVIKGLLNKQIGGELGATEGTVKVHRGRVMAKMEASSVPELLGMARKLGLLSEE
jgi:FixJ family two-component response regulator